MLENDKVAVAQKVARTASASTDNDEVARKAVKITRVQKSRSNSLLVSKEEKVPSRPNIGQSVLSSCTNPTDPSRLFFSLCSPSTRFPSITPPRRPTLYALHDDDTTIRHDTTPTVTIRRGRPVGAKNRERGEDEPKRVRKVRAKYVLATLLSGTHSLMTPHHRKAKKRKRNETDEDELDQLDELTDSPSRSHDPPLPHDPSYPLDPSLENNADGSAYHRQEEADRLLLEAQQRDYALQENLRQGMVDILAVDASTTPRAPLEERLDDPPGGENEFGEKSSFWEQEALEKQLQANLAENLGGLT